MAVVAQTAVGSYARKDSESALKLAEALRKAGAHIWVDKLDIPAGQRWDRAIQQALITCPRVVVLLSPESVSSENVMDEVNYAIEKGKAIIPVLLENCEVPYRLSRYQRIDVKEGISDLLRVLGVLKKVEPAPTSVGRMRYLRDFYARLYGQPQLAHLYTPTLLSEGKHSFAWHDAFTAIEDRLKKLLKHEGHITVSSGNTDVRCSGTRAEPWFSCEIWPSSSPIIRIWPERSLRYLQRYDFEYDEDTRNYVRVFVIDSATDIRNVSEVILGLLETVYQWPTNVTIELTIE